MQSTSQSTSSSSTTKDAAPPSSKNPPPTQQINQSYRVLALYKFISPHISKSTITSTLRPKIESLLRSVHARGTIILACEGINGTICYPLPESKDEVVEYLSQHEIYKGSRLRKSVSENQVFHRLKVKVKEEIVTIGDDVITLDNDDQQDIEDKDENNDQKKDYNNDDEDSNPAHRRTHRYPPSNPHTAPLSIDPTQTVGTYVKPGKDWNGLLDDPEVLVIDTRNSYEVEIGTFENAVDPNTECFQEFPGWLRNVAKECEYDDENNETEKEKEKDGEKDGKEESENQQVDEALPTKQPKAIAMFCTGGIRCEKATSYALSAKLFPSNVPIYHLEGGILAYLDNADKEEEEDCKFNGECYVFDHRVSVGKGCKETKNYKMCFGCRKPLSLEEMEQHEKEEKNNGIDYIPGVCCSRCKKHETDKQRFMERQRQIEIAKERGGVHMHDPKELGGDGEGNNDGAVAA